jgi:ribosome-binding ATPase YchF (GTP1/OBG family)
MKVGILGYAGVGKTGLFTVLTGQEVAAHAPGGKHLATVDVLDPRLDHLRTLWNPRKFTRARFEVEDEPAVPRSDVSGRAERVAGLREPDAFLLVVGAYEEAGMALGKELADPVRQRQALLDDLLLLDLEALEKRTGKTEEKLKKGAGDRAAMAREVEHLKRISAHVEAGKSPRELVDSDARRMLHELKLFLDRPIVTVFNVGEATLSDAAAVAKLRAAAPGCAVLTVPIEKEIAALDGADRAAFLSEYKLVEPAAALLTRLAYEALDLMSFFTMGPDEVRAWPITRGSSSVAAAGKIHSDLARGFIRAEVIPYAQIAAATNERELKSLSKEQLQGKEYVVQDGDILNIRFSV